MRITFCATGTDMPTELVTIGRHARTAAFAFLAVMASSLAASAQVTITDIARREVELDVPATRILLEAPAYYPALSLLSDDPASLIVGVGGGAGRSASEAEGGLAGKPRLGIIASGTFSVENAIALEPDLLITTLAQPGQNASVEAALERAGIPIVYVDFFIDAAANTIPSMEIIGRAIGEQERAKQFIELYRKRVDTITARLDEVAAPSPRTLIYRNSADDTCCWTFAGGFISSFFEPLHIDNVAADRLPGMLGQLNLEAVIESDPEIFVATDFAVSSLFAPGQSREDTVAALETLGRQTGLSELSAVENRRMHAMDITLMRSPLNVLAVELLAKWAHPTLFADLDPQSTLDEINARFLTTPLDGPFWASVDKSSDDASGEPATR